MNRTSLAKKALVLAVSAALFAPAAVVAAQTPPTAKSSTTSTPATGPAQNNEPTKHKAKKKQVKTLKGVMVLGSLIPQVDQVTAVPVTTYSPQEIEAQGFSSFSQFMQNIPQSSIVAAPDSQSANRAAASFEMHDLGPSRTLLLLDGERVIDYPQPSGLNTSQDLNVIPQGLVQSVDITPIGASSMYGSDAMNGVADVTLKQNLQGDQLKVTGGGDTQGGEQNRDIQFFGGRKGDKWNVSYSFEHKATSALFLSQRPEYADLANAGYGTYDPADREFGYQYGNHGGTAISLSQLGPNGKSQFVTPPAGACSKFGFMQQDTHTVQTEGDNVGPATNLGAECVQRAPSGGLALAPASKSNYVFLHGDYNFTPYLQAFATASFFDSTVKSGDGYPELGDGGLPAPFYDSASGQIITGFTRQLTSAETGQNSLTVSDDERYWNLVAGLDGAFGNFDWKASISSQKYIVDAYYRAFNATGAFNTLFGPQQGTKEVGGVTYPVYTVNPSFWQPITPQEYDSFAPMGEDTSNSELDDAQFNINNTELFDIPWNDLPVGWAARVSADHSRLATNPDPLQLQPTVDDQLAFEAPFPAVFGSATRQHYAVATELSIPFTKMLTFTTSGRIDKYNDASAADLARTWAANLEFRAYSGLLLRASYNTSFRAPGLGEVSFHDNPTISTNYADPLQCILANQATCVATEHSQPIEEQEAGNPFLKPETGNTKSIGFVWDVPGVENLSITGDYYRQFLANGIDVFSAGTILTLDAACLTGLQVGGAPFRGSSGTEIVTGKNSPICPAIEAAVPRGPNGQLLGVSAIPINISKFLIRGEDVTLQYDLRLESFGALQFRLQYDHVPFEAACTSGSCDNVAFGRSGGRMMWSTVWQSGKWHASLGGLRYSGLEADQWAGCSALPNGIIPSVGDPECSPYLGHTAPWIIFNGSVGYQVSKRLGLDLMVHNMFNKMGQIEDYGSSTGIPTNEGEYFNGRQVSITADYKID